VSGADSTGARKVRAEPAGRSDLGRELRVAGPANAALPSHVFLNGRVVAAGRARISVFDRGLQYGDGLFETLRVYRGQVFALADHLQRMSGSARLLEMQLPELDWEDAIARLLAALRLDHDDAWIRLVVTRGPAAPTLLPPSDPKPTVIILGGPLDPTLEEKRRRGVRVELLPFASSGMLAGHKTLDYLPALLGKRWAQSRGAYEGLYVDSRQRLSEGTTSNLFLVRDGTLLTPVTRGILPGVTRRVVLELARSRGLRVREVTLRCSDLASADEAFLSSSLAEIVPIVQVGRRRMGRGRPGPVTREVQAAYRAAVPPIPFRTS